MQHATAHWHSTGHPVIRSYEPGESWFYDYRSGRTFSGPALPDPQSRPADQPSPGPEGSVPKDWLDHIH